MIIDVDRKYKAWIAVHFYQLGPIPGKQNCG
jgi:hypothetical protein